MELAPHFPIASRTDQFGKGRSPLLPNPRYSTSRANASASNDGDFPPWRSALAFLVIGGRIDGL